MRIFLLGYPGEMGGANTECWHTVKLWREAGWEVHLVPTWGSDHDWEDRLNRIGCTTHHVARDKLAGVPGLAGSIAVGMCNSNYLTVLAELRRLGCKIVWVNCMTFLFDSEKTAFRRHGPADAYVFQSEFQRSQIEPELLTVGCDCGWGFLIRGALDLSEFPFRPRPHAPDTDFVVGRLARPDRDKWSSITWAIYGAVPYAKRKALMMGWTSSLEGKLGAPPDWATCLKPQEIPVQEFLSRCHALLSINGGAQENWPRVGLEAMAAGVPVVAQNQWGWPEMIAHGETGCLASNDEELAYYTAHLAYHEDRRLEMAEAARAHVEELTDPAVIAAGWQELFEAVEAREAMAFTPARAPCAHS